MSKRQDEIDHEITNWLEQLHKFKLEYSKDASQWFAIEDLIHKVRETFRQELD